MKDLYSILEISKSANDNEIKKAYKKKAFKYHPDRNKTSDAETMFKDITEAYEILMNPDKRRLYDNFGYESISGDMPIINPMELFQSLFNVDFSSVGESMNSNIFVFSDLSSTPFGPLINKMTYNLECTIEELYNGTQKEFTISHMTKKGQKNTKYIINVKKGSKKGDNILVKEGGNYISQLNITEDLVIQITEKENKRYKRIDNDLYITEDITLSEALTGFILYIDHFDDPLQIKFNTIIKPNQMYQVFGKGMPIKHDEKSLTDGNDTDYGNLIIDLNIVFPETLNDKQIKYLRKLLIHFDRKENEGTLVDAYYFKEREEVAKEFINEEEPSGCAQQ
jgi:DnaJ homolog subfamily B member 4